MKYWSCKDTLVKMNHAKLACNICHVLYRPADSGRDLTFASSPLVACARIITFYSSGQSQLFTLVESGTASGPRALSHQNSLPRGTSPAAVGTANGEQATGRVLGATGSGSRVARRH